MKKRYKNIKEIWTDIKKGYEINWVNELYTLTIEKSDCEYQDNHFTNNNGKVLRVTCKQNYFGSLLEKHELRQLYREVF